MKNKKYGYPRVHRHEGYFDLELEDASGRHSTIIPIVVADKGKTGQQSVYVNPQSDNFSDVDTSPTVFLNSYVKKFHLDVKIFVPPTGQETGLERVTYMHTPLAVTLDDLQADDDVSGRNLGNAFHLKEEDTNGNQVHPVWIAGNDLLNASQLHADIAGLDTNQTFEEINFTYDTFESDLHDSQLGNKMKACMGQDEMTTSLVDPERPYMAKGWINLPPKIRGFNKCTFFGYLVYLPPAGEMEQLWNAAETTDVGHLRIKYKVRFNEYNPEFIQTAT